MKIISDKIRSEKFNTESSVHCFFSQVFALLPKKVRLFLLCSYFKIIDRVTVDDTALKATYKLVQPKPLRGVFTLAFDEMNKIKELDLEVLVVIYPWSKFMFILGVFLPYSPNSIKSTINKCKHKKSTHQWLCQLCLLQVERMMGIVIPENNIY